ncbi:MAG TPA: hypothetical protein VFP66_11650 [Candidatus Limnocylindrales bacterium]|nr:hypothetical protein [Candidatus Limnocylindrales bacterium]
MTPVDRFERDLPNLLAELIVPTAAGDLTDALDRIAGVRQRPAWTLLERWLPMDAPFSGRVAPAMRPAWPIIALLVLAAMAGAILLVGSRQQRLPAPYGPSANGAILYSANGDIYIADANGGNSRVLIGGEGVDHAPVLANDGTRFVFFREVSTDHFALLGAKVDGTEIQQLARSDVAQPSWVDWSPDGSELLVAHVAEGRRVASIVSTDGSQAMRRLAVGDLEPEVPMWRPPDGREIVFQGRTADRVSLYVTGVDGSAVRAVTPVKDGLGLYLGPRLSPDGRRVTYWHNQIVNTADYPEGQKSEIHVLDLETGDDIRIGYDTEFWQELLPKFSPDGAAVLFVRKKFIPFASGASLTIAAADGSDGPGRKIDSGPLHDFGTDTGGMENPVFEFSPDGRKIIVAMGPQRRLLVIDVATGAVEQGDYGEFPFWQRIAP